jgi:hypothetical protein
MARREMKVTRKRSLGTKKKKDPTIKMTMQEKMKKKVATKNQNMMKLNHTKKIMITLRNRRVESMDTRNSTRRDQRPLDTTTRPTRMNTTKNTNSTMISMKMANIR